MQGIREYDERGHQPEAETADLEDRDVKVLGVVVAGIGILLAVVLVFVAIALILNFLADDGERTVGGNDLNPGISEIGPRYEAELPPLPRLQVNEPAEWDALTAEWQETLSTYGRTDNDEIHIPIDQAMKMVVERSMIPARDVKDVGQGAITEQDQESQDTSGGESSQPEEDK